MIHLLVKNVDEKMLMKVRHDLPEVGLEKAKLEPACGGM